MGAGDANELAQQIVQTHTQPRRVFRGQLSDGRALEARLTVGRHAAIAAATVLLRTELATRVTIARRPASGAMIDAIAGVVGTAVHVPAFASAGIEVSMAEPEWGRRWLAEPGVSETILALFSRPAAKEGALLVLRPGAFHFRVLRPQPLPVDAATWADWIDSASFALTAAERAPAPTIAQPKTRLERVADDPKAGQAVLVALLVGLTLVTMFAVGAMMALMIYLR